jgi:hydroxymethylbilane synthase
MGRGVFVKELEHALLSEGIDLAVHSLKDVPSSVPSGLVVQPVCERQDPRDVLVNRWNCPLEKLPAGARIGTSSPRREAQLRYLRPDLQALSIRGNVETRLRKAVGEDYDGTVLAAAGLVRLGLQESVAEYFSPETFVPDPGQGALAAEYRQDDDELATMVSRIVHRETAQAVMAERAFVEAIGGGCLVPVAAYGRVDSYLLVLSALVATPDGSQVLRAKASGSANNPHQVAVDAYQRLIEKGARKILEGARAG